MLSSLISSQGENATIQNTPTIGMIIPSIEFVDGFTFVITSQKPPNWTLSSGSLHMAAVREHMAQAPYRRTVLIGGGGIGKRIVGGGGDKMTR